ncbi:MAG: N-acyl-L-amino acid amidohydrolase [Bacteroidetes bacterium]|nr:N-acyl-L-amino acid amidohydrolase [Bacteroidota bacterium]
MKYKIQQLAEKFHPRVIEIRRQIHAHPELSYQENNTAALVAAELQKLNIPFTTGVAKTGVVGLIKGKNPDKRCIALRADMDALPIQEQNQTAYRSQNPGVMHACGHDMHTSNLLGAAMILSELKNEWEGTVKLIFQPSEEKMPSGANAMIEAGVMQDPKVEAIFGLHVHPELEAGQVGFRPGKFMASADEIYLTVKGKGGHAAQPSQFISPLIVSAEILLALRQFTDMNVPTVLSFGKIIADGATNVIPEKAELAGTLRCFDEDIRNKIHQDMTIVCKDIAKRYGADCEVNILKGYPVLTNDETLTAKTKSIAQDYLGAENIHDLPIRMGAEDFAYYSQLVPACFYRIGVANKARGITSAIHTPTFDIDEQALMVSVGLTSAIALDCLSAK